MTVAVVMGVSGSGKTTVATALARRLGWVFADADDLHPAANVAKMAGGHPLTDADRMPWLARVRGWIDERGAAGEDGVIACSALRRAYRDVLRAPEVVFVYLDCPHDVLARRLEHRPGHFMPASLLDSQLATLEPPGPDERTVVVPCTGALDSRVDAVAGLVAPG